MNKRKEAVRQKMLEKIHDIYKAKTYIYETNGEIKDLIDKDSINKLEILGLLKDQTNNIDTLHDMIKELGEFYHFEYVMR